MNREWRAKRNGGTTTPLPSQKKFFRFRGIDAKKESEEKESFNGTAAKDIFGANDDPYRFASEESDSSDEEPSTNWDSWTTDDDEETLSDWDSWTTGDDEETLSVAKNTEFSSPEIMRCQGYGEISPTAFLSEESLKCHFGSPKFASTRNQCTDDDIQFSDNSFPSTIIGKRQCGKPMFSSRRNQCTDDDIQFSDNSFPSTIIGKRQFGIPKFTSTRNQCTDDDIEFNDNSPSTLIGMTRKRRETIEDSNRRNLENVSPQLPVGINENYIKSPVWEDFENEVIRGREIPLESRSALSDEPHVCTEDLRHVSELSKEENLDINRDFLRSIKNFFQRRDLQDINSSMSEINTEDIVDDVFKNSNDTRSLKLDDAVLMNPDIPFEQQEAEERSKHELPKRSIVIEKIKLKKKRHLGTERSYRKKNQVSNLKNSKGKARSKARNSAKLNQSTEAVSKAANFWINKEKYMQTVPVCVLNLPKIPNADIERPEYPKEETRLIEAGTSKRRKNISKTLNEKKCREYEKYLKSVSICPLSLATFPSSRSRKLEN